MPELDILDQDGTLRWDAPGVLEATIYFPDRPDSRMGYEARWRAEHKHLLPANKRLRKQTTHGPAKAFGATEAIPIELHKRRVKIERVGAALWFQTILSKTAPQDASENKVAFVLAELGKDESVSTSHATLKRDWAVYRGVIHWCAAISYQRRVFKAPMLSHPRLGPPGYSIYAALFDFLQLADEFFAFAHDSGAFEPTKSFRPDRDLWTLPAAVTRLAPLRHPSWPDCNRVRANVCPSAAIMEDLQRYNATLFRA